MMTGPRTCGATFIAADPQAPSPPPPPPIKRTQKPPVVGDLPVQTAAPAAAPPAAPAGEAPPNEQIKVATGDKVQPPISREEHSKNEIQGIIKEYCAALEAMDPAQNSEDISKYRRVQASRSISTIQVREVCADDPAGVRAIGCGCRDRAGQSRRKADAGDEERRSAKNSRDNRFVDALAAGAQKQLAHWNHTSRAEAQGIGLPSP